MKHFIVFTVFALLKLNAQGQKLDSIYFNLYTDSLKKGTYNYINVEGVFSNGKVLPLDSSQLRFISSYGNFKGNTLWLPFDVTEEKISITVIQKNNPSRAIYKTIYIKKYEDAGLLKSPEEVNSGPARNKKRKQ